MRGYEDEDEEEYEDEQENENEDDEDDAMAQSQADPDDDDADADAEADMDEDGDGDGDGDADADADEDEDGDGDQDDGDGDDDEDEDGQGDDDEDDEDGDGDGDGDEDEDEEDNDAEGDEEDEDEDDGEGEADADEEDGEDVDMDRDGETIPTLPRTTPLRSLSPSRRPLAPQQIRRNQFIPSYNTPPSSLSIEAIVAIPVSTPVHALASTACSSYLLSGGQEGYVRAYDFYASVNGQQLMTAQQKMIVGMGETITKAGVPRGWWPNEVPDEVDEQVMEDGAVNGVNGNVDGQAQAPHVPAVEKRVEPVYSLAVEGDGLWSLVGSQSGSINLYTLRHAPGTLVHTLRGHSNVVSSMTLLPDERGFISGSWDGSIRQWDLNTGQTVLQHPTHGAQISSLSLRPYSAFAPPPPSPRAQEDEDEHDDSMKVDRPKVSISARPNFFIADRTEGEDGKDSAGDAKPSVPTDEVTVKTEVAEDVRTSDQSTSETGPNETSASVAPVGPVDVDMTAAASRASSYDPLFDDEDADAEGETAPPSGNITSVNTPHLPGMNGNGNGNAHGTASAPTAAPLGLALPGMGPPQTPSKNANGARNGIRTASSSPTPTPTPGGTRSNGARAPVRSGAADVFPLLSPAIYKQMSQDVLLASFMDGQVSLIDRRVRDYSRDGGTGVGRFMPGEKAPPWCMSACWSGDGNQVFAGRRNGTIDIWDVRRSSSSTAPNLLRTLRTPVESGSVSCVVAFPDGKHIATASQDNIRLWNTSDYYEPEESIAAMSTKKSRSKPPFKIIAGHHGGTISSMIVDPTSRFLTCASGDRGWQGESTKVILVHEVKW